MVIPLKLIGVKDLRQLRGFPAKEAESSVCVVDTLGNQIFRLLFISSSRPCGVLLERAEDDSGTSVE